jgi:3-phenylpropionate/trans-cinnamate dioxygenase ferredoxin reductase subunit
VRKVDFLLVGGGMASAYCASELRRRGAEGSILLVGRESDPPYERPPLTKEYMRAESERTDAYVNPADWYEENDVELLTRTSVMSLDAGERRATLQGGEEVEFDKALVATGAMVKILRVGGVELDGIHYIRVFANTEGIREEAEHGDRVVLVGGSYIACEAAASLTAKGKSCTMLMLEDVALSRSFGEEVGRFFQDQLESHGVEVLGGQEIEAFVGDGRVQGVRTKGGRTVRCDARQARRAGGGRRGRLRYEARDLGAGDLRRRRRLLLRQRHPPAAAAGRALGRGAPAGPPRGARDARRGGALPRGAVLLQ